MATGPCQAGFAGTHHYIYLGRGAARIPSNPFLNLHSLVARNTCKVKCAQPQYSITPL
jgi:hypothetical protein